MRRLTVVLSVLALTASAQLLTAQDSSSRTLRIVSASTNQEVSFRVHLNRSEASPGQTLQLRSSSAVYRRGDQLDIVTPAEFLLTTEAPFQLSLSTVSAGESLRLLIPAEGQELQITGARIVLARDAEGAPVYLQSVEQGEVRRIPTPQIRR